MGDVFYNDNDLLRWFNAATLERARRMLDDVEELALEGEHLSGRVRGRGRHPFHVSVDLGVSTRSRRNRLHAQCSCPLPNACEHLAAALIQAKVLAFDRPAQDVQPASPPASAAARPDILDVLSQWHAGRAARPAVTAPGPGRDVAFRLSAAAHRLGIEVLNTRIREDGREVLDKKLPLSPSLFLEPPPYMSPQDIGLLCQLWLLQQVPERAPQVRLRVLLQQIVDSGKGWVAGGPHPVRARQGPPRPAELRWTSGQTGEASMLTPALHIEEGLHGIVFDDAACYLDPLTGEVGDLQLPVDIEQAVAFLDMPTLLPGEQTLAAQVLSLAAPALPRPPVSEPDIKLIIARTMRPRLLLGTHDHRPPWRGAGVHRLDLATVSFDYDGHVAHAGDPSVFVHDAEGELAMLQRDPVAEAQRLEELRTVGLQPMPTAPADLPESVTAFHLTTYDWRAFILERVPALQALGWEVTADDSFRHQIARVERFSWDVEPDTDDPNWLTVGLDIEVSGHRVALAPLLQQLLVDDARWSAGSLDTIEDKEVLLLRTGEHGQLALEAGRVKPLVRLLGDLFAEGSGMLRIAAHDRGRLGALQDVAGLRTDGNAATRALARRLRQAPAPAPVEAPAGLQATLRPYQLEGLAWLQYLRQQDLGGVLADDMGLGKTLQTLSHILLEKESGRLQTPALVVVPTSLLHNWQSEAARFTPSLRVLVLHGPDRADRFGQIAEHDLVLTTYPLVWRDEAALHTCSYHLLILDEAQQVKNPKARAAVALRSLRSNHRLCLTGTPLENHLGELWAQFDFLLPDLLGSEKSFNKHWRHPIERNADQQRATLLSQRTRPFLLRRRKDQVARELPPKTIITRSIPLEGSQRDLYETVRASMATQVQEAIASRGVAQSHIVVLDALLKLRQVCCDPRLLPGSNATARPASAKLEALLQMLPELVAEGRRILVFSQFTSMLQLIGKALDAASLPYVTLTGQTRDRQVPIQRFVEGEVPVFLISLKAGGVGLNLTAADTVIHFDPWWNPAAENQASDRAHRIGQDKPVFIYRLIAAGSIEERIDELQQRKAALADSILEGTDASAPRFTDADVEALLAPLPDASGKTKRRGKRSKD